MKKILISLLLFSSLIFPQRIVLDTLAKYNNLTDSAKIVKLYTIGFNLRFVDPHLGLEMTQKAVEIAKQINNPMLQSRSLNYLGAIYRIIGNDHKALLLFSNAYRLADESNDSTEIAYAENNFAQTYLSRHSYHFALQHAQLSLQIFTSIGDNEGIGYAARTIGQAYFEQKDFEKALEFFQISYQARSTLGIASQMLFAVSSIAQVYAELKQNNKALELFQTAEREYLKIGEKNGLLNSRTDIAHFFYEIGDYNNARDYYEKAFAIATELNSSLLLVKIQNGRALNFGKLGHFEIGEPYLINALELALATKDIYKISSCYDTHTEFYKAKGDLAKALYYSKLAIACKDSINQTDSFVGFGEIEALYQNDKNNRAMLLLKKENESSIVARNYVTVSILLSLGVIGFISWLFFSKKRSIAKLNELNAMKDKFFSIIAHDLKSPFHSLMGISDIILEDYQNGEYENLEEYATIIKDSTDRGYRLLLNLLDWSRSQSNNASINITPLHLQSIANNNADILSGTATAKDISIRIYINNSLYCLADENMLNTIFRNLIGNAIKYSFRGSQITIVGAQKKGKVYISIQDNGIGIKNDILKSLFSIDRNYSVSGTEEEKGTGLGLILCKEFISKMGGEIWAESELKKGTTFRFSLPSHEKQ